MVNARSLRRLAGDHAALHTSALPPNYLFPPESSNDASADLTSLDVLLAGPTETPYEGGVFKLHLTIPETYPADPPKAFFRTKIFHPNVDDNTGAVCVETLKRDWEPKLTLRDILVTISCLLVVPNASSALNAEAGMLLEQGDDGWVAFDKRARFMTRIHSGIPKEIRDAVLEAQARGNEGAKEAVERHHSGIAMVGARRGKRRREMTKPSVETPVQAMDSPASVPDEPAFASPDAKRPFVVQSGNDDVFGVCIPPPYQDEDNFSDSDLPDADQENDKSKSTVFSGTTIFPSPVRQGPAVPLGELQISDSSFESEYPPSPKKSPHKRHETADSSFESEHPPSPRKSPMKRQLLFGGTNNYENQVEMTNSRPESSRAAGMRRPLFTPQLQHNDNDDDSELSMFTIRKPAAGGSRARRALTKRQATPEDPFNGPRLSDRVAKAKTKAVAPPPRDAKSKEQRRNERMREKLWELCGSDVDAWNRGDFGGFLEMKAAKW